MDWHARYIQQARWTYQIRRYLFDRAGLDSARRVLDVGCGTGALLGELPALTGAQIHGLDLNLPAAKQAFGNAPTANLVCADGLTLPYPEATFDMAFCHFLLLWVKNPVQVLTEMRRVTKPGGKIAALAEPDYGGRIDHPAPLDELGRWQAQSLRRQGADTCAGRSLRGWFLKAGITPLETGIIGNGWNDPPPARERELEWDVICSDLEGFVPGDDIQKMKKLDEHAWVSGERVLFVPTFYCLGAV